MPDVFYKKLLECGFKLSLEEVSAGHEKLDRERHIIEQLTVLFSTCKISDGEQRLLTKMSLIPSLSFGFELAKRWFSQSNRTMLNHLIRTGWLKSFRNSDKTEYVMHSVIAAAVRKQSADCLYETCRDFIVEIAKDMQYGRDDHGSEKADLIQFSWSINDLLENHLIHEDTDFLFYLAGIYTDTANYSRALKLLFRTIQIYRRNKGKNIVNMCAAYNSIGLAFNAMEQNPYAISQCKKALKIAKSHKENMQMLPSILSNMGMALLRLNNPRSLECFLKAYKLGVAQFGENDPETLKFYFHYGNCVVNSGDEARGLEIYRSVIAREEEIFGCEHLRVAGSYHFVGNFLYDLGEYSEATMFLLKALAVRKEKLGVEHPDTTDTQNTLGLVSVHHGDYKTAKEYFTTVYTNTRMRLGDENTQVAAALNNLGLVAFYEEDYEVALEYCGKAKAIYEELDKENFEKIGSALNNIGYVYIENGSPSVALKYFEQALELYIKKPGRFVDSIAQTYYGMASAYYALDQRNEACNAFELSIKYRISCRGEDHVTLASTYNNYALLLEREGAYDEAMRYFKKAKKILLSVFGENAPNSDVVDEHLARVRRLCGGDGSEINNV